MTQTAGVAGLSGWLNQILGELDLGAVKSAAEGGDFVRSLAAQIRTLAVKHGADPAELAALDDQTLVKRCLALLGDRQPLCAATGLSLGLGALGLKAEMGPADGMATDSGSEDSEIGPAPDNQAQSAVFAWLPAQVLERLQASAALLAVADAQSPAQVSGQKVWGKVSGAQRMPIGMVQSEGEMGLQTSALPSSAAEQRMIFGMQSAAQWSETEVLTLPTDGQSGSERASAPASPHTLLPEGEAGMQLTMGPRGGWWRQVLAAMTAESSASGQPAPAGTTGESGVKDPTQAALGEGLGGSALDQGSAVAAGAPGRLASETPIAAARAQVLDLNRLLQPGGERPLVEQIRWSVEQGLDTAEIRLHPPNLGSLEVRVVQEGERIHVHFTAAHPVAREVLDAAIPRLREALAQAGLWLGETSVSDQAPRRDQGQGRQNPHPLEAQAIEDLEEDQRRSPGSTLAVLARRLDVFT